MSLVNDYLRYLLSKFTIKTVIKIFSLSSMLYNTNSTTAYCLSAAVQSGDHFMTKSADQ